jgi:hypothetical protein
MGCENCGKQHDKSYGSGRFCSQTCARGFATKSKRTEINQKVSALLRYPDRVYLCKECKVVFTRRSTGQTVRDFCSNSCSLKARWKNPEQVEKHKAACKGKVGGLRPGSGRGKQGRYKGRVVQSTWECAYLIWCDHEGHKVTRNLGSLEYEFEGRKRKFYPDFFVNGELVEIKGYRTEQSEAKRIAHPAVKFLFQEDLKDIFDMVSRLTGLVVPDLYKLYD